MEKNMKLKQARDVILAYLMKEDFTLEECDKVFEMCVDEINAAVKRQKFVEIKKEGEE
ncbi:MAG: hypothetical protein IJD91_01160 [Clostridia bacterium]|nr:hypothetical protein [Clostridia bacterium]